MTKPAVIKLALFAAMFGALWGLSDSLGLRNSLSPEGIQALALGAGCMGMLAFVGAFSVGSLIQVPGIAFLVGARVAYGPGLGFLIAYVGALAAITLSFVVVRAIGGQALAEIRWKPMRKMLAKLEARPVRTVVLLRSVLMLSPPLNYALAMSRVRFRDYFVGSAIGLAAPIAVWVFLSDVVLSVFGGWV